MVSQQHAVIITIMVLLMRATMLELVRARWTRFIDIGARNGSFGSRNEVEGSLPDLVSGCQLVLESSNASTNTREGHMIDHGSATCLVAATEFLQLWRH